MVRKLALAVSLALGTISVPVHALGLGELSSKSALNQNFEADINLLSVLPEELDAVRVKLADAEAFARAGVERPFYLSLLKFEPTLSTKGRTVIRVTSEFPIREPFLNFLVEVNWPNGRLLREYTVLLDPPTTTMRRAPKVAAAAKAAPAAPVQQQAAPRAAPKPAPSPALAPAPRAGVSGSEYGPIRANETAWSIAKKVRPGGVSMEQMMIALLEANPQAFINRNINLLRKGQILRVPSLSEIKEISRQEARKAYRQQQDQWLASRNEKVQSTAASQTAAAAVATEGAQAAKAEDQLRIASAQPEGEGSAAADKSDALAPASDDLNSRLILARENAETSRLEAENLRSRVDELQARLSDMQKLLTLKDDQLAQLQDRVATGEPAPDAVDAAQASAETPVSGAAGADGTLPEQLDLTATALVEGAGEQAPGAAAEGTESAVAVAEDTVAAGVESLAGEAEQAAQAVVESAIDEGAAETLADAQETAPSDGGLVIGPGDSRLEIGILEEGADATVAVAETPEPSPGTGIAGSASEGGQEAVVGEAEPVTVAGEDRPGVVTGEVTSAEPPGEVVEPPAVEQEMAAGAIAEPEPAAAAETESFLPQPWARIVEQNKLSIAAGGVALLGLVGWLSMRGRGKEQVAETVPEEAMAVTAAEASALPDAAESDVAETPAVDERAVDEQAVDEPSLDAAALADLPDSSFFDELSPSDINTLQDETGEVDPVSEADVYIAYGRYQQAEELLRQAMSRDPDRLGLKHKLLEVHYATRNGEAFANLAREMVDAGQDAADEGAWKRAQGMGRELAPDNALFASQEGASGLALAGAAGVAAGAAAAADDADSLLLDDLDLSELTAEFDADESDTVDLETPSEVSITLDLEDVPEVAQSTVEDLPEPIKLDDLESIEFELPEGEAADLASADSDEVMSDSFDLDSMMTAANEAVDGDEASLSLDSEFSADELQAQLDELSDLSVLASDSEQPRDEEAPDTSAVLGLVTEDGELAGDELDQPISLDTAVDADDDDMLELRDVAPSGDAGDEDEVATKLDLARAYVEMGDEDGARSILEEVVVEGNSAQRGDAEQLLGQIG